MKKKIAIITGASGNMGQSVVRKFLSKGYRVIGAIIADDPVKININDENFEKIVVDLISEPDSEKFVNSIIEKYGSIDVVVHTVGGFALGSIAETKIAAIQKQYKLNFETAYNIVRPVFVQMLQQNGGRIFLVGSRPGLDARNSKGMIAYGLGKSLIFRLAELMNEEAKGKNVVAAVVVPSTIDTAQNRKAMPDADPGNWVSADEIADAVYFYCSEGAAALREPVLKLYKNV